MNIKMSETAHDKDIPILPTPVTAPTANGSRLLDAVWILVNGIATVIVVFLNKIVFADPQLRNCQIISAIWHFAITFLLLYLASRRPFHLLSAVRLPIRQVLPICTMFAAFLVLNNLSLTYNTIGFFQLAKILTTPCVVLFNFLLFRGTVSRYRLVSVVIACVGVAIANGVSAESNPVGAVIAVFAFATTALYQIWIAKSLQEMDVSAPQLLLNQTPVSSLLLLGLVPFFDTMPVFGDIPSKVILSFIGSGLVAAMINVSQFLIIGRTSALTFNIVSIAKTVTILALGWSIEGKVFTAADIFGVGMALGGAFMYAQSSK